MDMGALTMVSRFFVGRMIFCEYKRWPWMCCLSSFRCKIEESKWKIRLTWRPAENQLWPPSINRAEVEPRGCPCYNKIGSPLQINVKVNPP